MLLSKWARRLGLGGSMFPRFLMTDTMQKVGLVTFNAWPQLLVLGALTVAFLVARGCLGDDGRRCRRRL